MSRMRVVLNNVSCSDTEDVTGPDEFYLVGAISDGTVTRAVLTKPISVNDGQTKSFGQGGGIVFDQDVQDNNVLKIALVAFDEDAGKDWAKYGDLVSIIGNAVSAGLATMPNPTTWAASVLIPFAIGAVGGLMGLDKDDRLGQYSCDFPVSALEIGEHPQTWPFRGGHTRWSNWNYAVRFTITKG